MSRVVGIDLGTSNCVIALVERGEPRVIATTQGKRIASTVAFTRNGEKLIGCPAKQQAVVNGENTVFSVKRFLGRRFDDPEVVAQRERLSCRLTCGPKGDVRFYIPSIEKEFTPQEIAAILLNHLKQEAEAYLGESVTQAVITVPAYFNDNQRQAVKDAGKIAGLEILRIINEPTAAALVYGRDHRKDETILVVDLGGGTFDVSVLRVSDGLVEVKATSGHANLGGADWDGVVVEWVLNNFLRAHGVDLSKNRQALQRIREAAEKAKIELSDATETEISLPFIHADGDGSKHLGMKLTRVQFEELTQHLVERLVEPVQQVLADAGLISAGALDAVVLVGGTTRIPGVQAKIQELTGREATTYDQPDEVVVRGAALQASMLAGEVQDVHLRDVTPVSLGLETMGGMMAIVIPRNTPVPVRRSEIFSTAEDRQTEVNVHVLQGERPMAADNNTLGVFRLEGIPSAPRGVPQIEVTFEIDANGILHVSAQDRSTQVRQTVTISNSTNLGEEEIERMVREAEQCAGQDRRRRDLTEARSVAEQVVYQTQRTLQHLNGQIPDVGHQEIVVQVAALRSALAENDVKRIRRLTGAVQQASMMWCQIVYPTMASQEPEPESGSVKGRPRRPHSRRWQPSDI